MALLVDPMLATGGSAIRTCEILKAAGVARLKLLSLIAAPEGISRMNEAMPDVAIHVGAVDERLNEVGLHRPGPGRCGRPPVRDGHGSLRAMTAPAASSMNHGKVSQAMMRAVDLIRKKRDGEELTSQEIDWMVAGIASKEVADYQWSALLMAIIWRGMTLARPPRSPRP